MARFIRLISQRSDSFIRCSALATPRRLLSVTSPPSPSSGSGSGFSLLTPGSLNEVVKLDVLMQESSDRIKEIWSESHTVNKTGLHICGDLDVQQDRLLRSNGKKCPMFVFPVFKGSDDQYMMLFSQFQENMFILTYLEEYKRNPASARPWMQVTLYDELVEEKAIGLYRADFIPELSEAESTKLLKILLYMYSDEEMYNSHVLIFNKHPERFDFNNYVDSVKKIALRTIEDNNHTASDVK